ncbi:MAG: hypothetical protein QM764_11260 [Chitinophagaceae bacterium]
MKTTASPRLAALILLIPGFFMAGCMKDNVRRTFKIYSPVYESLSEYRASVGAIAATTIKATGKIAVSGNYIFISTPSEGIHVIDNSNPAKPKNISFINIPGNADLAIAGNTLYADAHSDLVTFDIQNPANPVTKKFITNVFPNYGGYFILNKQYNSYSYYNSTMGPVSDDSMYVIKEWTSRDTTVDENQQHPLYYVDCVNCSFYYSAGSAGTNVSVPSGNGTTTNGSLSRFAIANNFLYTMGYDSLSSFDITDRFTPTLKGKTFVNYSSETIFPFKDKLFIGTTNGMYMLDIQSSPENPSLIGQVAHMRSCDPVIADDNYAYVTLRDGTKCSGYTNQLEVYDINNLSSPSLLKTYPLTHPTGLSKDGDILFVCDGKDGLKIFNAADKNNLKLIKQITGGETVDVIAYNGIAIVMTTDGIYEYSYADLNKIHMISKL